MEAQQALDAILNLCFPTMLSVEEIQAKGVLFAHYTSLEVMRSILKENEIWFSNPVFMNDLQELEYGVEAGISLVQQSDPIRQVFSSQPERSLFQAWLTRYVNEFRIDHSFNIYVFCMSEHDRNDINGILSMWRAYGQNGQGGALVLNSSFLRKGRDSPLLIAPVKYALPYERSQIILKLIETWCTSVQALAINLQDQGMLAAAVQALFVSIKVLALTIKDAGFSEEREWRLIYMPDQDPHNILTPYFSYSIDEKGIAPKLKLPIRPLDLDPPQTWTFDDILTSIIFGPGISFQRHGGAIKQLLADCQKTDSAHKVRFSLIPLRFT